MVSEIEHERRICADCGGEIREDQDWALISTPRGQVQHHGLLNNCMDIRYRAGLERAAEILLDMQSRIDADAFAARLRLDETMRNALGANWITLTEGEDAIRKELEGLK